MQETNIVLTGHHDPIVTDDEEVNKMREVVKNLVLEINEDFLMHDFRMVKGPTKTNIIFEIAVILKLYDLILMYPFYILNFEKAESWLDLF